MLDLGFFKRMNGFYGYKAGDEILVTVAKTLRTSVGETAVRRAIRRFFGCFAWSAAASASFRMKNQRICCFRQINDSVRRKAGWKEIVYQ